MFLRLLLHFMLSIMILVEVTCAAEPRAFENKISDRVDMSGMNLTGLDMSNMHMNQSDLRNSDLKNSNLNGTYLKSA